MTASLFRSLALLFVTIAIPMTVVRAGGGLVNGEGPVIPEGLFAAMDAGQVEAKFIPQNTAKANLMLRNLTDKPLHVRLPRAFAGVPAQGQFGGGGMGGMGGGMGGMGGGMGGMGGGMGGGGGGQAMGGGGGMGGMGGGMGGGGMGGGMFRIEPGKVQKVALQTVCLEHGKPDPTPKMDYVIVPLDRVTQDPAVEAICTALGDGQVAQNTAQAATWHLMDNLGWSELAAKNRVESAYTGNTPWFSPLELRSAMAVVTEAKAIARKQMDATEGSSQSQSTGHENL